MEKSGVRTCKCNNGYVCMAHQIEIPNKDMFTEKQMIERAAIDAADARGDEQVVPISSVVDLMQNKDSDMRIYFAQEVKKLARLEGGDWNAALIAVIEILKPYEN